MGNQGMRRFLGLVLLAALPASTTLAESNAAILYANGPVNVNGAGITRSVALFAGDSVRTSATGITISANGSTITAPANTSIIFKGQAVELGSGGVEISTKNGMAATVSALTVKPAANGTAKFQVARLNGMVTIAAEHGAVLLSDGTSSTVVQEGTQTARAEQNAPDQNGPSSKLKKTAAAPRWPSPAIPIGIGVAAAATAGTLAITTTGSPTSPDRR